MDCIMKGLRQGIAVSILKLPNSQYLQSREWIGCHLLIVLVHILFILHLHMPQISQRHRGVGAFFAFSFLFIHTTWVLRGWSFSTFF